MASVGWFGIPGDLSGRHSTLTHAVQDGVLLCGCKLRPVMEYQWCSSAANLLPECQRCFKKLKEMLLARFEHESKMAKRIMGEQR